MPRVKVCVLLAALAPFAAAAAAQAQDDQTGPQVTVVDPNHPELVNPPPPAGPQQESPIPPNVEGPAVQAQGGGYCYGGPHPAPGGGWEAITTPHMHDYAPFDTRLFSFHEGCYYFIGDPRDFGYTGQSYSYYGAHPILDEYGGGWCFMIGAHTHWWRPWSPYFTVVGPWYYWNGPYDPFFWSYWPYYSFFYRSYYPSYYAGGRFNRTWRTAPAISHVPASGWRGGPAGGWRGSPGVSRGAYGAAPGAWRSSPGAVNGYHAPAAPGGGWRGAPAAGGAGAYHAPPAGAWHGSPVPSTSSSPLRAAPYSGGWHVPSGGFHPVPSSGGGWHAPSGGFHSAPSGGGWHAPSGGFHGGGGGGFHSGGGFHGGRR
ncbi:MAG TPA: hypothetical protein VHL80_02330 [Polyangia bacterium]|nr:hypothetical protein [Polyangia bacterium]